MNVREELVQEIKKAAKRQATYHLKEAIANLKWLGKHEEDFGYRRDNADVIETLRQLLKYLNGG